MLADPESSRPLSRVAEESAVESSGGLRPGILPSNLPSFIIDDSPRGEEDVLPKSATGSQSATGRVAEAVAAVLTEESHLCSCNKVKCLFPCDGSMNHAGILEEGMGGRWEEEGRGDDGVYTMNHGAFPHRQMFHFVTAESHLYAGTGPFTATQLPLLDAQQAAQMARFDAQADLLDQTEAAQKMRGNIRGLDDPRCEQHAFPPTPAEGEPENRVRTRGEPRIGGAGEENTFARGEPRIGGAGFDIARRALERGSSVPHSTTHSAALSDHSRSFPHLLPRSRSFPSSPSSGSRPTRRKSIVTGLQQAVCRNVTEDLAHDKLSRYAVIALVFFNVSGGPWGSEELFTYGPGIGVFTILLVALLYAFPQCELTTELSSSFPVNGGYSLWVTEAFGPFWGFQESYWSWLSGRAMSC